MNITTLMCTNHGLVTDTSTNGTLKIIHVLPDDKELELYDLNPVIEILNDINAMITAGLLSLSITGVNEIHLTCTDRLHLYGDISLENVILHNPDIEDSEIADIEIKSPGKIVRIRGGISTYSSTF